MPPGNLAQRSIAPKVRTVYVGAVRIISVGTLRNFWIKPGRQDAEQALRTWVHVVRGADWSTPNDVKETFRRADILRGSRAIFDIGGNKYRLVAAIHYRGKRVYIRFIGTHAEYDRIDPETV
jgi:mRNA interferase HigB